MMWQGVSSTSTIQDAGENGIHASASETELCRMKQSASNPLESPRSTRSRLNSSLTSRHTSPDLSIEAELDENDETPILQTVMDRIEDEMEAHTYEELVPLEVKLALEDKVFGWTHLTSSFIGHSFFTVGAYLVTYEIVTFVYKHAAVTSEVNEWLVWLRVFLSLWVAVATYRMVRRRRRVWFRSAYGSKSYKQDAERRRQSVAETDRTTALGRFVQHFKHRRVLRKLKKAETQFAKKQKKQQETLKQRMKGNTFISQKSSSFGSATISEKDSLLDRSPSDMSLMSSGESTSEDESAVENPLGASYNTSSSPSSPSPRKRRLRRPSFDTKPTYRMHSVGHDEILMEETIRVMPYAHGGFFGAAPFLLSNPHWISILRHLMPDVYVEISRRVALSPPSRLIHWAENNPVVAAYGTAHALEQNDICPNLEWDVFLDPALVRRVQVVLDHQTEFRKRDSDGRHDRERTEHIEAYYQQELKRRSRQLVDKMLIAHGSSIQLIAEQLGVGKDFVYSRIKRTRQILGGGIYARQWMAVFGEALKLGLCHQDEDGSSSPSKVSDAHSKQIASLLALAESSCPESTMAESVKLVERITASKKPVGLVLDIKSRHVPLHIWAIVVDTLRTAGIRVEGVASFCIEEIRDLSRFSSLEPIPEMIFCHSAGDLQQACHDGKIQRGDKIFFNAGSLIHDSRTRSWTEMFFGEFDARQVKDGYRIHPFGLPRNDSTSTSMSCLQDYKERFSLSIGLYCQEFAIDEAALGMLVRLVNENPSIYDLGFSWGGIDGITIQGIAPGRFTKTDGFWNQRHIGLTWNCELSPPTAPCPAIAHTADATTTRLLIQQ